MHLSPDIEYPYLSTIELVIGNFPSKTYMNHHFLGFFGHYDFFEVFGWIAWDVSDGAEGKERSLNGLITSK